MRLGAGPLNVSLRVTSAAASAWVVDVPTVRPAWAGAVIRRKLANAARRIFTAGNPRHPTCAVSRFLHLGLVFAEDVAQGAADLADAGLVLERLADRREQVVGAVGRVLELLESLVGQRLVPGGLELLQAL